MIIALKKLQKKPHKWFLFYINDEIVTKINKEIEDLRTSFQDGVDKICNKLTGLGFTPNDPKGPDQINDQIQRIYDERYNKGYLDGKNDTAPSGAEIRYTYHHHNDSCFISRTGTITMKASGVASDGTYDNRFICNTCGVMVGRVGKNPDGSNTNWGITTSGATHHCAPLQTCKWYEGEIEKAEIIYMKP